MVTKQVFYSDRNGGEWKLIDASNGNVLWSNSYGGSVGGGDWYEDGGIFYSVGQYNITAVDVATGSEEFTVSIGDSAGFGSNPANGDMLNVSRGSGFAYYDYQDKSLKWSFRAPSYKSYAEHTVSIRQGRALIGANGGWTIIDVSDGSIIKDVGNGNSYVGVMRTDGEKAFVADTDTGDIQKYDISSDSVEWTIQTGIVVYDIEYDNGELLLAGSNSSQNESRFAIYNSSDGSEKYTAATRGNRVSFGAFGASRVALGMGAPDSELIFHDRSTGDGLSYYKHRGYVSDGLVAGPNFKKKEITGQVTKSSDGNPLFSASATVEETGDTVNVDGSGSYSVPLENGVYTLTADDADYEASSVEIDISVTSTLDFSLSALPATITGVVRDANNNGVGGKEVVDSYGNSAITNPDGTYTIKSPPNSTVQIAGLDGYDVRELQTGANEDISDVNFQYGGISITVLGPDDSTIEGAEVSLGDNTYKTESTGKATDLAIPPTAFRVYVQRVDTGVDVSPNEGQVVEYTEKAGKMGKLTLRENGSLDKIGSLPVRELNGGAISLSDSSGKAKVLLFDGSKDLAIQIASSDRRYKSVLVRPDIPSGSVYTGEILLERKVAVGNK